jgi:hypothetical protein
MSNVTKEQAIEALHALIEATPKGATHLATYALTLSAFIEAAPEKGGEAVAWRWRYLLDHGIYSQWRHSATMEHVKAKIAAQRALEPYRGWRDQIEPLYAHPAAAKEPGVTDKALLDFIASEYCDLRCFDIPTGAGDGDVGWRVIKHYVAKPHERTVGEVYRDDPRAALAAALAQQQGTTLHTEKVSFDPELNSGIAIRCTVDGSGSDL